MTTTTVVLEPGTPPPMQRLRALERLAAAGIPCGIALAPVLPRLTDTLSNLEAVVQAAADHGAAWIWSGSLHLEPAVRDWLLDALHQHFPSVTPAYARIYGTPGYDGGARYTPQCYSTALNQRVAEIKGATDFSNVARLLLPSGSIPMCPPR